MRRIAITFAVLATTIATFSCDATDKVENKITCADVCKRYKDCFDSDYDVDKCTDQCESEANSDEDKDKQLEKSDDCIDDESCTSAVFKCSTDCTGVLLQ
ncbi:MAG: hypothetical protein QM784_19690 [Polyangiaceae bacterium]